MLDRPRKGPFFGLYAERRASVCIAVRRNFAFRGAATVSGRNKEYDVVEAGGDAQAQRGKRWGVKIPLPTRDLGENPPIYFFRLHHCIVYSESMRCKQLMNPLHAQVYIPNEGLCGPSIWRHWLSCRIDETPKTSRRHAGPVTTTWCPRDNIYA